MYLDKFSTDCILFQEISFIGKVYHNCLKVIQRLRIRWKLKPKIKQKRLTEALEILENWGITGDDALTVLSEMGGGNDA